MKIGLNWRNVLSGAGDLGVAVMREFDSLMDALRLWGGKQHNDDGTHGDVTCTSLVSQGFLSAQRLRLGPPITVNVTVDGTVVMPAATLPPGIIQITLTSGTKRIDGLYHVGYKVGDVVILANTSDAEASSMGDTNLSIQLQSTTAPNTTRFKGVSTTSVVVLQPGRFVIALRSRNNGDGNEYWRLTGAGSLGDQASNNVSITGGTISGATISGGTITNSVIHTNSIVQITGAGNSPTGAGIELTYDTVTGLGVVRSINHGVVFTPVGLEGSSIQMRLGALVVADWDASGNFLPHADNTYNNGDATHRWKLVRGVTITPGDLRLANGWTITEHDKVGIEQPGVAFLDDNDDLAAFLGRNGVWYVSETRSLSELQWTKTTHAERCAMCGPDSLADESANRPPTPYLLD